MEKTYNVSLNGISFTLEENANLMVRKYLDTLSGHYRNNRNGEEIMECIENRIAELLTDCGGKSGTVSAVTMAEVLNIIGKPEDIYDDDSAEKPEERAKSIRKKLYRNPDEKIIGGVFGGLAAFFNVDVVWLRAGYSILFVLFCFIDGYFEHWLPGFLILAYLIMHICTPEAHTTAQKCEMHGETLSYDDIEKKVENKAGAKASNVSGTILKIAGTCLGILLLIIGIGGAIGMVCAFLGIAVAGIALPHFLSGTISDIAGMPVWSIRLVPVLALLCVFLPFVGMLYGGIALAFNFKASKWRPGLVIFILWLLSVIGITACGIAGYTKFKGAEKIERCEVFEPASDTLHIKFTGLDQWKDAKVFAKGDTDNYELALIDASNRKNLGLAVYPKIEIDRIKEGNPAIKFSGENYDRDRIAGDYFKIQGNTLYLSPSAHGKGNKFSTADMEIEISIPDSVKVSISEPVAHDFRSTFDFADWKHFIFHHK